MQPESMTQPHLHKTKIPNFLMMFAVRGDAVGGGRAERATSTSIRPSVRRSVGLRLYYTTHVDAAPGIRSTDAGARGPDANGRRDADGCVKDGARARSPDNGGYRQTTPEVGGNLINIPKVKDKREER